MNAFGPGYYKILGNYHIVAYFGNNTHYIKFNEDYTSFVSKREGDNNIMEGNLVF